MNSGKTYRSFLVCPATNLQKVDPFLGNHLHLLQARRKLPRRLVIDGIQLDADAEPRMGGRPNGLDNLHHDPGPRRRRSAVAVRPLVGLFRQELGQEVAVGAVNLYPVEAGVGRQPRRVGEALHHKGNVLGSHLPRRAEDETRGETLDDAGAKVQRYSARGDALVHVAPGSGSYWRLATRVVQLDNGRRVVALARVRPRGPSFEHVGVFDVAVKGHIGWRAQVAVVDLDIARHD